MKNHLLCGSENIENVLCTHIKNDSHTFWLVDVAVHIIVFICRPKPKRDNPRSIVLISKALFRIDIRVPAKNTRRRNRSNFPLSIEHYDHYTIYTIL